MTKLADIITAGVSRASDILFVQNPKGTSVGAFCGIAADGLLKFLTPALSRLREWIDPDRINTFYLIAAGIAVFNIPHVFRRRQLPNSIEDAFEVIRRMKRDGASPTQVKLQYLALCNAVVEQAKLDQTKLAGRTGRHRQGAGSPLRERF